MNVFAMVLSILGMIMLFGGWIVGMINFIRIFREARNAGKTFWELYWFGAYRYAFNEKRGSPETRWMTIGFGTMLGSIVVWVLAGLVSGAARR
jgi:hypothetical protein